jgi:hypothetical protein
MKDEDTTLTGLPAVRMFLVLAIHPRLRIGIVAGYYDPEYPKVILLLDTAG